MATGALACISDFDMQHEVRLIVQKNKRLEPHTSNFAKKRKPKRNHDCTLVCFSSEISAYHRGHNTATAITTSALRR